MKKMQCEVCGGTEIKKLSDNIFQCQSCGIQYTKNDLQKLLVEITGEVKIDRSEDIENALTRAKQYEEVGVTEKALEYYDKVLDLAPNHEKALQGIEALKEQQSETNQRKLDALVAQSSKIKLLKHTLEPSKGIHIFLKSLKQDQEIAPDIYKEIEIISVKQGYFPFSIAERKYSGNYDAIACYRKKIPYTDYETKTEYKNGSSKTYQVAVTKYREEIERNKVDGSYLLEHRGAFSTCSSLNSMFTSLSPDKFDKTLKDDKSYDEIYEDDLWPTYYNDAVLMQFERMIALKFSKLKNKLIDISFSEQKKLGELDIYGNDNDPIWIDRIESALSETIREKARDKVHDIVPGDFSENVHYRWFETSSNDQTVYFPIQVIEYAYRGKFYICAMLLAEACPIIHSYPCCLALKRTEIAAEKRLSEANRMTFPSLLIILYSFAAAFIVCGIKFGLEDPDFGSVLLLIGCIPGMPAILWNILWLRKRNRIRKNAASQSADALNRVQSDHAAELEIGYQIFFRIFQGIENVDAATSAVKKASSYHGDLSTVKARILYGHMLTSPTEAEIIHENLSEPIKDSNGHDLADDSLYTVILVNSGNRRTEVCKILREAGKIGLASAKEIADKQNVTLKSHLSAEEAGLLAEKLQSAGASIKITKEQ